MSTSRGIALADRYVDDLVARTIEQLPDALIAVERGELIERAARERERVAAPVVVPARGQRAVAAAGEQLADGRGADPGLVAEHQDHDLAAWIDRGQGGGD